MGLFDFFSKGNSKKEREEPALTAEGADSSPGWDAISAACDQLYPDQTSPLHYGTIIKYRLGGPDPLDGVSIYRVSEPVPHWHYVSYGFSDLYGEQEGPDEQGESGYGFELTFRLADEAALTAEQAPVWPINMMQNLARYVFETGNTFADGHHLDANGPIELDSDTQLTAIGFITDPALGSINTPSGQVTFLQMLGLTSDDLDDAKTWRSQKLFALLEEKYPKGVTHMDRDSLRTDPELAKQIAEGKERDGSGMGYLYVPVLRLAHNADKIVVMLGALAARSLGTMIASRLLHGEEFSLADQQTILTLAPGEADRVEWKNENVATITLTSDSVHEIQQTLRPQQGVYTAPAVVTWHVEPTEIKDEKGNVTDVIG